MTRDWVTDPPETAKELGEALADKCLELIAAERRATVDRIRAAMQNPENMLTSFNAPVPDEPQGFIKAYVAAALDRILDEEAAR